MKLLILTSLFVSILPSQIPQVGAESGMANFAQGKDGSIYLSWIDSFGTGGHALRFAKWDGKQWSNPETISQGKGWFVNWADFPALSVLEDGSMLAHWLTRFPQGGTYGYGIRVASRTAAKGAWKETYGMSLDDKNDYAGFLSFVPGGAGALYLAPPKPQEDHRKTVRFVSFVKDGSVAKDLELDSDACSCCQTTIGRTARGFIAAYRDHQPGEIRDIAVVREHGGTWSKPEIIHPDGWKINGCPTDGPAIAAQGNEAAIVWLTRAGNQPRVKVVLSRDAGLKFGHPVVMDDGKPSGRPSIALLDAQNYVAVWLEKKNEQLIEIRLRRIGVDGSKGRSRIMGEVQAGRGVGFPRVAVAGNRVAVAWRDGNVRLAWVTVEDLR